MASNKGIMSLPRSMSLNESYGAMQQSMAKSNPKASQAVNQALDRITPMLNKLDSKTLGLLLQLTQYLKDHKSQYKQVIAKLAAKGSLPPGVFPENYDPKFLSVFALSIAHAQQSRGMAAGGIADVAQNMKDQGRGKDTMLAHISPKEAELLRANGGVGTLNPTTGLPEFNVLDDIGNGLKGVGDFIGDVLRPVGNVIGDILHSPLGMAAIAAAGMYFFGTPTVSALASSALPGDAVLSTALPGDAVLSAALPNEVAALSGEQVAALTPETVAQLTPAAIEAGMGTPGYGFNASAAESGLFDPANIGAGAASDFPTSGLTAKDVFKKGKDLLSKEPEKKKQADPNEMAKLMAILEMINSQNQPKDLPVPKLSENSQLPYDSPVKKKSSYPNYTQTAAHGGLMMDQRYGIGGLTANRTQTNYLEQMQEPNYRPGQGGISYFSPVEYKSLTDIGNAAGASLSTAGISTLMPESVGTSGGGARGMGFEAQTIKDSQDAWKNLSDEEKIKYFSENPTMLKVQEVLTDRFPFKTAEWERANKINLAARAMIASRNAIANPIAEPGSPLMKQYAEQYAMYNNPNAGIVPTPVEAPAPEGAVTFGPIGPEKSIITTDLPPSSENLGGYPVGDDSNDNARSNSTYSANYGGTSYGQVAPGYTGGSEAARGGLMDSRYAHGGITSLAQGGYSLGSYSDGGRLLRGPGDGVSDGIPAIIGNKQPARLANGEFVIPARIVSELGNGSTDAGAKRLYEMMDRIQKVRRKTKNVAANTKAAKYLPA